MTPKQVIDYFGTQANAASALGINQASIAKWVKTGCIPSLRQLQLESFTGDLKADPMILPRKQHRKPKQAA